ncbi:hypothetical protein QZH41_006484 [Actinostola sp. cb2023]|nr:hypothetical protein QZH41_006484 [Actinostola sp. cb2023]
MTARPFNPSGLIDNDTTQPEYVDEEDTDYPRKYAQCDVCYPSNDVNCDIEQSFNYKDDDDDVYVVATITDHVYPSQKPEDFEIKCFKAIELFTMGMFTRTLQEKVELLLKEQEVAKKALEDLQNPSRSSGVKRQFVVVPRERKIKTFSGRPKDGSSEQTIEEFIEEVKTIIGARDMSKAEQLDFITSHLEGAAKEELKVYPEEDRRDPKKVFEILGDAFGEKRSKPQLLKAFYDRRQKDGESLREFSHALSELWTRVVKKDTKCSADSDTMLRDQFADNVRDALLRKELKRSIRVRPGISFLDIREEGISWSEEEEKSPHATQRFRNTTSTSEVKAESCILQGKDPQDSTLRDLAKMLQQQQEAIKELTAAVARLKSSPERKRPQGQLCYKCRKPGHFARNCTQKEPDTQGDGRKDTKKYASASEQATNQEPKPPSN